MAGKENGNDNWKKKEKVDLLYVYNENDLPKLKKDVEYQLEVLLGETKDEIDNGIDFTNSTTLS